MSHSSLPVHSSPPSPTDQSGARETGIEGALEGRGAETEEANIKIERSNCYKERATERKTEIEKERESKNQIEKKPTLA
jgi:hypothetical protein